MAQGLVTKIDRSREVHKCRREDGCLENARAAGEETRRKGWTSQDGMGSDCKCLLRACVQWDCRYEEYIAHA